jgi:ADP-ribose pyrophosphatase
MSREVVFRGRKIQVAVDTLTLPGGGTARRDVVLHPGAVAILPMVEADRICLVRNRREIVGETLLEIPAGTLDPGEAPEQTAIRELAEETGYRAERWRKLGAFFPSPGVLSETTHLFIAEGLTPGELKLEPDEEIKPEIVSWPQALAWVLDGTIRDAKTIVGLLLWDRLRAAGQ